MEFACILRLGFGQCRAADRRQGVGGGLGSIRTEKATERDLDNRFKFGAEAGVTLVGVGIGLEGGSTTAVGADIVAFANSAGLSAGASLEGSYLDTDQDWDALYYGPGATTRAIVLEGKYSNPGAEPIRRYLAKW